MVADLKAEAIERMAGDATTLLALAARAEAGGDATLSDDVWRTMGWERHEIQMAWWTECWTHPSRGEDNPEYGPRPDLQISLDAQSELPGRIVSVDLATDEAGKECWFAYPDQKTEGDDPEPVQGCASTEALARLAALLRALAQKESGDGA